MSEQLHVANPATAECVCERAPQAGGSWPPAPHSTAAPNLGMVAASVAASVIPVCVLEKTKRIAR